MNKKALIILLPILLCGCNKIPSSSTSQELTKEQQLNKLYETLKKADGHVNSVDVETISTVYYMTEGSPLTMPAKDMSTLERFESSQGQITVQKGSQSMSQDSSGNFTNFFSYEKQIFYDNSKFYQIADFGDQGSYNEIAFVADNIDLVLNIAFAGTEKNNITELINALSDDRFGVEFNGINDYVSDGEWNYSYTYIAYESATSKVKQQEFIYQNTLTMKNGIIDKVTQHSEANIYSGGYKGNWKITDSTFIFHQGDYETFTGTRFNPTDYKQYA